MEDQSNPTEPVTPTPNSETATISQTPLECQIETYHAISEWIRFADAKAAVVLTVGAALAGFLIPSVKLSLGETTVQAIPYWHVITLCLFVTYLVFGLLSSCFAFLCINPLRTRKGHPSLGYCRLFHPAAISAEFKMDEVQRFTDASQEGGADEMRRQVQAAILLDSHISANKYNKVTKAIKLFALSAFFGFAYFLAAQF